MPEPIDPRSEAVSEGKKVRTADIVKEKQSPTVPTEQLVTVELIPGRGDPATIIGTWLPESMSAKLVRCLQRNACISIFESFDSLRVDTTVVVHCLKVDSMVDSMSGWELVPTRDAYRSYHQEKTNPADIPKVAFRICAGIFSYQNVPIGQQILCKSDSLERSVKGVSKLNEYDTGCKPNVAFKIQMSTDFT